MSNPEENIIQALQDPTRQRQAFGEVVRLYSNQLYWQVRKLVLIHEDADDIVQNTFLKAWTNLHYFRGDAKISTWLYRIALNESLSYLSQKSKQPQINSAEEVNQLIDSLESDPYFDGDEIEKKLQRAIASLPEKQRIVFVMRYREEIKYEEMSEILGTSVGALKASYHHAVRKIESAMNDED